jgi:hypothetical protein
MAVTVVLNDYSSRRDGGRGHPHSGWQAASAGHSLRLAAEFTPEPPSTQAEPESLGLLTPSLSRLGLGLGVQVASDRAAGPGATGRLVAARGQWPLRIRGRARPSLRLLPSQAGTLRYMISYMIS